VPALEGQYIYIRFDAGYTGNLPAQWELAALRGDLLAWLPVGGSHPAPYPLSLDVFKRFSSVESVCSIYLDIRGSQIRFWVFIANDRYDDKLMNQLIDREKTVLEAHPEEKVDFIYVPLSGAPHPREVVGDEASLIFER
jgi:hypothetical protein